MLRVPLARTVDHPSRAALVLVGSIVASMLASCGGNSGSIPPPPPPPPIPRISVTLPGTTRLALDAGQSAMLSAIVRNDPSNKGVQWTVSCPTGVLNCGQMATPTSASGATDMFTAPSTVNATEIVTVSATSVTCGPQACSSPSFQITVNPAPMIVSPSALPDGFVGQRYGRASSGCVNPLAPPCVQGVTFAAGGGISPYAWSWMGAPPSSLPPGLRFNGPIQAQAIHYGCPNPGICGTPTIAGTYNVVVTVTDSSSPAAHASMNYTIVIH